MTSDKIIACIGITSFRTSRYLPTIFKGVAKAFVQCFTAQNPPTFKFFLWDISHFVLELRKIIIFLFLKKTQKFSHLPAWDSGSSVAPGGCMTGPRRLQAGSEEAWRLQAGMEGVRRFQTETEESQWI